MLLPLPAISRMAAAEPRLLEIDPAVVGLRVSNLAALLGVEIEDARLLVAAQPRLLLPATETLRNNFAAMVEVGVVIQFHVENKMQMAATQTSVSHTDI